MTDYTVHTQRALLCCARVWIEARRHWNAMMLSAQLSWLLGSTIDSFHLTTSPGVHSLSPLLLLEQRPIERCLHPPSATPDIPVAQSSLLVHKQIGRVSGAATAISHVSSYILILPRPTPNTALLIPTTDDRLVLLQPCPTACAIYAQCLRTETPLPRLSPAAAPLQTMQLRPTLKSAPSRRCALPLSPSSLPSPIPRPPRPTWARPRARPRIASPRPDERASA